MSTKARVKVQFLCLSEMKPNLMLDTQGLQLFLGIRDEREHLKNDNYNFLQTEMRSFCLSKAHTYYF